MAAATALARFGLPRRTAGGAAVIHQPITGDDIVRDPGASEAYTVRLLRPVELTDADQARWAELSTAAGTANVFAEHWFMHAALRHAGSARAAWLAIVQRRDGGWIGALPLTIQPRFGRWPVANWQTWSATNQFLGSPLVRPDAAHGFWTALLRHLDDHGNGGTLLHCRQFAWDDPACAALIDVCAASGRGFRLLDRFERAARLPNQILALQGKPRARLRSLARRLNRDHGPVSIDIQTSSADCERWINDFLALEQSGWKGRAGSALGCASQTEALFREVIAQGRKHGQVRLATLATGDRPLAMSSWFVGGDRGFGFKMAYDEAYRAYAPGLLLMRHVADEIDRHPAMLFDTCASAGGNCAQQLWGGNRTIFDCAVAVGPPLRRLLFDGLMQARAAYTAIMPG
ncbi:GNAT family N-acetyltransferase [Sphingopyxis sp. YF1]|uniref:GNAT family N-acetyltransferase n=1 Tax=Sphingopyxis sp. YF1 TaxID=2482763 RepID=UPI001F6110CC|nr:GNAT family N-acetyltransferase [Sphingopyxis sp. YF1]UNU44169.1 GNAT family N-acetyltransferase [Sphingopyxis sp. YF1]